MMETREFGINDTNDRRNENNLLMLLDNPNLRRTASDLNTTGNLADSQRIEFRSQNHLNRTKTLDKNFRSSYHFDQRQNMNTMDPVSYGNNLSADSREQRHLSRSKTLDKNFRSTGHLNRTNSPSTVNQVNPEHVVLRNRDQTRILDKSHRSSYHFDERQSMDVQRMINSIDDQQKPEFRSESHLNRAHTMDKNFRR